MEAGIGVTVSYRRGRLGTDRPWSLGRWEMYRYRRIADQVVRLALLALVALAGVTITPVLALGEVVEFPGPDIRGFPHTGHPGIVRGPDGNVWFVAEQTFSGTALGRITPAGVITLFPAVEPQLN